MHSSITAAWIDRWTCTVTFLSSCSPTSTSRTYVIHREREINFTYVGKSTLSIPVVCTNNRQMKEPNNERIHHSTWGLQGPQFQLVFFAVTTNYVLACKPDTKRFEKHAVCFLRFHMSRVKKQCGLTLDSLPKHWHLPTRQHGVTDQSSEQLTKQVTSRWSNELYTEVSYSGMWQSVDW